MTQPAAEPDAEQVRRRIEQLVELEHRLWTGAAGTGERPERHERLARISRELDGCWDALRRRRASPSVPLHPSGVSAPPNELEGPEPEPPHLERGSPRPADQSGPEPTINPDVP